MQHDQIKRRAVRHEEEKKFTSYDVGGELEGNKYPGTGESR